MCTCRWSQRRGISGVRRTAGGCTGLGMVQGGYSRVGIPVGYYPCTQPPRSQLLEEQTPSEAGPGSPVGAGVGGVCSGRTGTDPGAHPPLLLPTHHSLRSGPGPCRALVGRAAPCGQRARFDVISCKVSKTAECHRKVSKRPVIVPIFQNRVQKSPLEILRFPISVAFSPKELMGLF